MTQARQPDEMGVPAPTLGTNTPSELTPPALKAPKTPLATNIINIEKATYRLLPGALTGALAQSGLNTSELDRAARLIAMNFDLSPAYLFGGVATPKDPYTGEALSLSHFRRITEDAKPAILEAMAPALFAPSSDERAAERPWIASANAARLSRHIRAFGPLLAEYHPYAHEAIGLALEVSKRALDPTKFAANLQAFIDWYRVDRTTLMRQHELDWPDLATLAIEATQAKKGLRSAMDVRGFLFPELGKLAEDGRKAQAAAQANADARGSWTMYGGGQATNWLETNVDDLTPAATALIMADWGNPALQAELTKRFGNTAEKRAARDKVRRQAEIEQQRLKIQAMGIGGSVSDVEGVQDAYDILSDPNGDWFKASQMIQGDVMDSNAAWSRSYVGRALTSVVDVFNAYYKGIDRAIVWGAHNLNMLLLTDPAQEQREEAIYDWYKRQMAAGRSMGSLWAERLGIPTWIGSMGEFVLQVALDPLVFVGKGLKAYRGTRAASGLLDRTTFTKSLLAKTPGVDNVRGLLGLGTMAEKAEALKDAAINRYLGAARHFSENEAARFAKAFASGEPVDVIRTIRKFGLNYGTGPALDEPLLLKAQEAYIARYGRGVITKDSTVEVRDMLMSTFDMRPPGTGSLADDAWRGRQIATNEARKALDDVGELAPRTYAPEETGLMAEATTKDLGDALVDEFTGNPKHFEVPHFRAVANPLRRAGEVLDQAFPRARSKFRQTWGLNPGPMVNINEDVGRWARLTATRSDLFKPREIDELVAKVQLARRSANPEVAIEKAINDNLIGEVVRRSVVSNKIPESLIPAIREDIEKSFGRFRKQAFGLEDGKVFGARPILETQRVNELVFPDVLQIRKYVDAYASTYNDLLKNAPKELSDLLAGGGLRAEAGLRDRALDFLSRDVVRPLVGSWKTITVPRPGYVLRVIGVDESTRWLATSYGIWERLGASQLERVAEQLVNVTGKGFSTSLGIAAAATAGLGNPVLSAELAGAAAAAGAISLRPVRQAIARGAAKPLDALLDAIYPIETFPFGDAIISLERPGVSILDDPFANTVSRAREAMEQALRDASAMSRRYRFTDDFGKVTPKDSHYYETLAHNLNNVLGWSEPGGLALKSIRDGASLAETKALLTKWAKGEGRLVLRQMGWKPEDTNRWVDLLSTMAHSYTGGDRRLAALAVQREVDELALRKINTALLPDIVGPLVQEAAFGNSNGLRRLVEFWYDTWVQSPENILNRQPYYKAAKRRAERAYLRLAKEANVPNMDVDALRLSIDAASRQFALGQVKKIMFDFSENSRLGELMYAIYPFLQPYMEAFSVYGYILAHRNPALPVYARHLWDFGKETGFLRKDEQTGEYVIPTSWVAGASIALAQFADMPGAQTLMPIQAISLWSNSSARLPDEFPLIGGLNVAVPSLSPFFQAAGQYFFGDTRSDMLASYLFAYGPNVQVLPSAYQKFLQATFPEMFAEGMLDTIAMDYIIEYQYRGVHQDLANKPSSDPKRWNSALEEMAYKDAQQHMAMRAFLSFNGVGTTLYRWEWAPIRQEYFDLIEQYGGNTMKAKEDFLKKYPSYGAMTVGKSVVGPAVTDWVDEKGNIIPSQTGLRIPTTEYARRMLNSPAGEELLRRFGPLVATLLLQADPALQEPDFATYSQMVAKGLLETKTITQFVMDVEQAGLAGKNPLIVDEHEGFWGAIVSFYEYKAGIEEGLKAQGLSEGSQRFDDLDAQEQELLSSLRAYFPVSADYYLDQDAAGKWTIAYGASGKAEPDALTLAKFKAFAAMPQLQGFNVVKGLNYYLDRLDPIRREMVDAGVRSIKDAGAIALGLDKDYEELITYMDKNYPEAAYAVKALLPGVLLAVPNKGEDVVNKWRENNDPRYRALLDFEEGQADLRLQLPGTQFGWQRSEIYNGLTQIMNETYRDHPDVVQAWWDKKSYGERKQYVDGLLTRYVGYMSTWDLHLLGLDVDDKTVGQMRQIADQRIQAQRQQELLGSKFDRETVYGPVEQMENIFIATNPKYAEVVNAQRTWGYALLKSEYVQGNDAAAATWRNFARVLSVTQMWATQNKLLGTKYGSAADKDAYIARRKALIALVESFKSQDEKFKNQWEALQKGYGDLLINYFMPDYYFDYPLGPVSPRQAA